MIDRNHPAVLAALDEFKRVMWVEDIVRVILTSAHRTAMTAAITAALEHLTADDLPTRLVRDIQARTIRAAARAAIREEDGIPWDHDWDRATVSAWLGELADELEREARA